MDEKKVLEKKDKRGGKREGAGRKALTKNNNTFFCWRISADFRKKLQEYAQNEKKSVSDFLRSLVIDYERRKTAAEE